MKGISLTLVSFAAAGLFCAACTVHKTEAPGLTGPSEAALSSSVTASPDSLTQDGKSMSTIAVVARDAGGRPLSSASFRLDILVDGQPSDYGTLSTRNLVTGSDGRASAVYTAPAELPAGASAGVCAGGAVSAPLGGRCVQIVATSVGSDFSAASSRLVEIHLIPTGVIVPSSATPVASFTATPSGPAANASVQFDATKSCAGALNASGQCPALAGAISSYAWSFGDGATGTGQTTSHAFSREQTYLVTLTVSNDRGLSASSTQSLTIGAGSLPTPAFVFSPTAPVLNQDVYFNASASKPGAGHSLERFVWSWGDGTASADSSSTTSSHKYTAAGSYVVTLSVADESGQTASLPQTVTVGAAVGASPTASFVFSPTGPVVAQQVNFDATQSKAGTGHSLTQYRWNWGDGSALSTSASPTASHSFTVAGTFSVALTVTDEVGQVATVNQTVTVGPAVGTSPTASFAFSPTGPVVAQQVNFDATQSKAGTGHSLTQYRWNWGDGSALSTSASPTASHSFTVAGTFSVALTVTDEVGQVATVNQTVTVTAVVVDLPKAVFSKSSPDPIVPGQSAFFDATLSTVAAGHTISGYLWSWGDGTTSSGGPLNSHIYSAAGIYQVILSVTDNTGLIGVSAAQAVTVTAGPTAVFISSPAPGAATLPVYFDASQSSGSGGVTNYNWNWGDGTQSSSGTALIDHTYALAGKYTVLLTVTDGATPSHTGTVTHDVTIN